MKEGLADRKETGLIQMRTAKVTLSGVNGSPSLTRAAADPLPTHSWVPPIGGCSKSRLPTEFTHRDTTRAASPWNRSK